MTTDAAETNAFDKWEPPECPFAIEYRRSLMQELRAAVAYGQQAFTRGGMEVGGVLFGNRTAEGLSIRAWRPMGCEHASGPAFVLSERDRIELRKFLQSAPGLPDLTGVAPVGWFLSHTRSDLSLRESDVAVYNEFFPGPAEVALVLRPGRHNAARAGFFFRDASGAIQTDRSVLEFNIEASDDGWPATHAGAHPLHGRDLPFPPERRHAIAPGAAETNPLPAATSARASKPTPAVSGAPVETTPLAVNSRRSWRWIALPIAALAAIGWLYFSQNGRPDPPEIPIEMTVLDHDGQLAIAWDHARPELRAARGGRLSIVDGAVRQDIPLTSALARTGSLTWVRGSAAVQVYLHLDTNGKPLVGSAQFLGAAPQTAPARDPDSDALRKENLELRGEVDRANARADEAEAAYRALQNRIDLESGTKK